MKWVKKILSTLLQIIIMAILPFWIFIRGAVWLYESYHWYHWFALLLTFLVVGLILLIYVAMMWDAIFGENKITRRSIKGKVSFVLILLTLYGGYTLFNLSDANAKSREVKKEYLSLHPFMRIAVGTFVWLDKSVLITDMSRVSEDYKKMGLKSLKNSLHYVQKDGYVHAMDLRTKGRNEVRNTLLKWYFQALGFNTLRHTGTEDHLHVSLSVWEKPGAI